jgi:hypothetical protein
LLGLEALARRQRLQRLKAALAATAAYMAVVVVVDRAREMAREDQLLAAMAGLALL